VREQDDFCQIMSPLEGLQEEAENVQTGRVLISKEDQNK